MTENQVILVVFASIFGGDLTMILLLVWLDEKGFSERASTAGAVLGGIFFPLVWLGLLLYGAACVPRDTWEALRAIAALGRELRGRRHL